MRNKKVGAAETRRIQLRKERYHDNERGGGLLGSLLRLAKLPIDSVGENAFTEDMAMGGKLRMRGCAEKLRWR